MTLTRAHLETLLIRRAGALLIEADLDGSTLDGSNADLNDPIGWAIRQCGGSVGNLVATLDADVATVAAADYDKLLDFAEYRLLQNISGNVALVDIEVGERRESFNQLRIGIEQRIDRKARQLERDYGFGLGTLQAGVIGLDFMQKLECE